MWLIHYHVLILYHPQTHSDCCVHWELSGISYIYIYYIDWPGLDKFGRLVGRRHFPLALFASLCVLFWRACFVSIIARENHDGRHHHPNRSIIVQPLSLSWGITWAGWLDDCMAGLKEGISVASLSRCIRRIYIYICVRYLCGLAPPWRTQPCRQKKKKSLKLKQFDISFDFSFYKLFI